MAVTALTVAPAAVGTALGILAGGHLKRRYRHSIASTLLAIGVAATIPVAVGAVNRLVRGPQSKRGAQRTLDEIRTHDGLPLEDDPTAQEETMVDFRPASSSQS
ncbi:MAG: hypothetical protein AAGJ31_16230 [Verrucomicrobiota bacterium]